MMKCLNKYLALVGVICAIGILIIGIFSSYAGIDGKLSEDDPNYWLNKGAICATYGNDIAAIKYFKKAIELDSNNASAHFDQGVCYGAIGEYDEALSSLNKAIETCPDKASYFYGRGRVYLLSGDKEKAIEDFKRAAELGNRDARDYLDLNGAKIEGAQIQGGQG